MSRGTFTRSIFDPEVFDCGGDAALRRVRTARGSGIARTARSKKPDEGKEATD